MPSDGAAAWSVQHGRRSPPVSGSRRASRAQYPSPPTSDLRKLTHVPQLVAERLQMKQLGRSTWTVRQFGQRHVVIDPDSSLWAWGVGRRREQDDQRTGRNLLGCRRILLSDLAII